MRLYEITNNTLKYDATMAGDLLREQNAKKYHRALYESNANVGKYNAFIASYRKNALDPSSLNVGSIYYPLSLIAMPLSQTINVLYVPGPNTLDKIEQNNLHFTSSIAPFRMPFPIHLNGMGVEQDMFVFDDEDYRKKLLLNMRLAFGQWTINE